MGEHRRRHQEQQHAAEVRRGRMTKGAAAAVVAGLLFGIFQYTNKGKEDPFAVTKAEIEAVYDCDFDSDISIQVVDKLDGAPTEYGSYVSAGGNTKNNKVRLLATDTQNEQNNILKHEYMHACVDDMPKMFERRYEIKDSGGLQAVGAEGFLVWFSDSTEERPNTFNEIEEGTAEWLAKGIPSYEPSDFGGYVALSNLTGMLAENSGLDRQEVFEMHEQSNLEGFIAAVYKKPVAELTDQNVNDFIFIYQNTLLLETAPTMDELAMFGIE